MHSRQDLGEDTLNYLKDEGFIKRTPIEPDDLSEEELVKEMAKFDQNINRFKKKQNRKRKSCESIINDIEKERKNDQDANVEGLKAQLHSERMAVWKSRIFAKVNELGFQKTSSLRTNLNTESDGNNNKRVPIYESDVTTDIINNIPDKLIIELEDEDKENMPTIREDMLEEMDTDDYLDYLIPGRSKRTGDNQSNAEPDGDESSNDDTGDGGMDEELTHDPGGGVNLDEGALDNDSENEEDQED